MCGRPLDFRNTLRNISIRRGFPLVQSAMIGLARLLFPEDFALSVTSAAAATGAAGGGALLHVACGKGGLTGLVARSGRAFFFGGNKFGQCGTGVPPQLHGADVIALPAEGAGAGDSADGGGGGGGALAPVEGFAPGERVVGLAVGQEHALAVTDRGACYAWGRGDRGQLGQGGRAHLLRAVRVLGAAPALAWADGSGGGALVVAVQAGAHQSAALDARGRLWLWVKRGALEHREARADGCIMADQLEPRRVAFADEAALDAAEDEAAALAEARAGALTEAEAAARAAAAEAEAAEAMRARSVVAVRLAEEEDGKWVEAEAVTGAPLITRADTLPVALAVTMVTDAPTPTLGAAASGSLASASASASALPSASAATLRRRRRVVAVSLGQAHGCLLTDDGRLWMVGMRGRGVLFDDAPAGAAAGGAAAAAAEGPEEPLLPEVFMQTEPLEVAAGPLAGLRVAALRCGLHHCYALTDAGRVFRWGWRGRVAEVAELAELARGAAAGGAEAAPGAAADNGGGGGGVGGVGAGGGGGGRVREFSEGFAHRVLLVE